MLASKLFLKQKYIPGMFAIFIPITLSQCTYRVEQEAGFTVPSVFLQCIDRVSFCLLMNIEIIIKLSL